MPISLESFGVRLSVAAEDKSTMGEVSDAVERALPASLRLPPSYSEVEHVFRLNGGRNDYSLFLNDDPLAENRSRTNIIQVLETRLRLTVAEFARDFVFLHAGAVGLSSIGLIIPGRSMQGKTSLVVELIRRGAAYFSDEYAVIDKQGCLHPFPKTLSVRENSGNQTQIEYSPEAFGSRTALQPIKVGMILITNYSPGASFAPRPIGRPEAMMELLKNSISIRRNPEFVLSVLGNLLDNTAAVRTERNEAAEAASKCIQLWHPDLH